jgi:hypothetical protein
MPKETELMPYGHQLPWAHLDLNQEQPGYEPGTLTN